MKLFDQALLDELVMKAKASPRLRANHNVHEDLHEPVQRLFIAIEPGSYVRPHLHPEAEKWEFFLVLRGKLAVLLFDEKGVVLRREVLSATGPLRGFEIPPNTWHCVVALESGSVFFEVKQGPYIPMSDKGFAAWAPKEGESGSETFTRWMAHAQVGDSPPII